VSSSPRSSPSADRRVLVTGAAGFLGSHLVRRLLESDFEVVGVVRPGGSVMPFADSGRLSVVEIDLDSGVVDSSQFEPLRNVSTVYHLAGAGLHEAQASDGRAVARTNVLGTFAVLDLLAAVDARRIVHCGSGLEYGPGRMLSESSGLRPASLYAATKAAASLVVQARVSPDRFTIVRPFTVYGPRDSPRSLVSQTIASALRAEEILTTAGEQTRDFIHVDDVVDALLLAGAPGAPTGVFNLATGRETSVRSLVELIVELCGGGTPRFGAIPYRSGEPSYCSGSATLARTVLRWQARIPLRAGLERTIAWHASSAAGSRKDATAAAS
jgi:UDP-glucose 4-epimerase